MTLVVALSLVLAGTPVLQAELVSTSRALALEGAAGEPGGGDLELARDALTGELVALGVDPEVARLRVSMLSAGEVREVSGKLEELPAGGDLIGVLGITFVVLLVLELVGVIDIFKKI